LTEQPSYISVENGKRTIFIFIAVAIARS